MAQSILAFIRGVFLLIFLALMTLLMAIFVFFGALLRLIPVPKFRGWIGLNMFNMPEYWASILKVLLKLFSPTQWHIHGFNQISSTARYAMVANHRSWADILVLQTIFSGKIPPLRFFMKKELLWQLPLFGHACKLIGYPFMQRYSQEFLQQNPELKGKDIEETRKACERFRDHPVTFINFIEGGRFTQEKHLKQKSPYRYLLKPKAGGLSFILTAMGKQLDGLIDVSIIYPDMKISFWDFLCGRVKNIHVFIHTVPIKHELFGDYQTDAHYREFFQYWLNELWAEKDKFIINTMRSQQFPYLKGDTDIREFETTL